MDKVVSLVMSSVAGLFMLGFQMVTANKALAVDGPLVARAQFTTAVEEREPVDNVVILSAENEKVYFFSDLRNLGGQLVKHRWEYNGKVEAEVEFEVGGDRWRVFSSKMLDPAKLGEWTVVVVDSKGWPLRAVLFEYADGPTKLHEE